MNKPFKNHSSKSLLIQSESNHRFFGREINLNSIDNIHSTMELKASSNQLKPLQKNISLNLSRHYSSNSTLPSINESNEISDLKSTEDKENINNISFYSEKKEKEQRNDPQLVPEYSDEIFYYLKNNERINTPDYSNLFEKQSKINEQYRTILINWICHVHYKFSLLPETLFLTINILDAYTSLSKFDITEYQLVAVASMLIASKYEEYYAPEIKDFIYVTKGTYTKEQIIKMEYSIMCALKFDILFSSGIKFLEYFSFYNKNKFHNEKIDKRQFHLAQFILEISLMNVGIMKYSASMRASSALYMSRKILKNEIEDKDNIWSNELHLKTGYNEGKLKQCVREMILYLQTVLKRKSCAFKEKFNSFEYSQVGMIFTKKN